MTESTLLRALVVDDEHPIQVLTSRALRAEGFHCDQASDGEEAKRRIEAGKRYDLVVADLKMPKMHGHALVSDLLARPDPPMVVVLTGVIEPRLAKDLIGRGVEDVVFKPTDYAVFASKVRALLDRRIERRSRPGSAQAAQLEIADATARLEGQLVQIQAGFQQTIEKLKKQGKELEDSYLGSVRMLANLIEQTGRSRGSHAVRVEDIAQAVGRETGLDPISLRNLKLAALLHDIGQFGMPDQVRVQAPWDLAPADRILYERYPVVGATLLSQVPGSGALVDILEAHTENFDGTGFPHRKKGSQVPLAARVLRLADGVDTWMLHARRLGDSSAAIDHLRAHAGTSYDPRLVEVAIGWFEEKATQVAEEAVVVDVHASELRVGLRLAQDVYDESRIFLARQGVTLSEAMVPRLQAALGDQTIKVFE